MIECSAMCELSYINNIQEKSLGTFLLIDEVKITLDIAYVLRFMLTSTTYFTDGHSN